MAKDGVGEKIEVEFDGKRCIHARRCVTGLPEVWKGGVEGNWIFPDNAPVEEVASVVRACPSGALRFRRKDGGAEEAAPAYNVVQVLENGPYAVRADATLGGEDHGYRMTLCRCGASRNKPFCDNTHLRAKFEATGEVPTAEQVGEYGEHGPLAITPLKDGPLQLDGPFEVVAGSGRKVERTRQQWLCRCGRSASKPFCDGSHRAARFKADGVE